MGTVNERRLIEIRNYLLKRVPDDHFSMVSLASRNIFKRRLKIDSSHPACLASHICYYYNYYPTFSILHSASVLLGLVLPDAYTLFLMAGYTGLDADHVTPKDAANVLTRYLDVGEFSWNNL